jgi:two-component system chemotaxis response regulator CheB
MIPEFPGEFPLPIVIVLHMPVGYTAMYAYRLNEISALTVVEAKAGDLISAGMVYIAPAGQHLTFGRGTDGTVRCQLDLRPADTLHRPSVDVLFESAARTYGEKVIGVVMTGMGSDGMIGAGHIKANGGRVVTEAESSCIVYGMPRAVVEGMGSDRSVPLDDMASTIMEMI